MKKIIVVLSVLVLFFSFARPTSACDEEKAHEKGEVRSVLFKGTSVKVWIPESIASQLKGTATFQGDVYDLGPDLLVVALPYMTFYIAHTNYSFPKVLGYSFYRTDYYIHGKCHKGNLMAKKVEVKAFFEFMEKKKGKY